MGDFGLCTVLRPSMILHINTSVSRLRNLLDIFFVLFAAVAISAPAAARETHEFSHAGAPVTTGEHHHHEDDGDVTTHAVDRDIVPQPDDNAAGTLGHSHMASTAFDGVPQAAHQLRGSLMPAGHAPAPANTPVLGTLGWSPQKRPPRTA